MNTKIKIYEELQNAKVKSTTKLPSLLPVIEEDEEEKKDIQTKLNQFSKL